MFNGVAHHTLMSKPINVKIHSNVTHVLIYVSVLKKTLVGTVDIEVIEDLHRQPANLEP
jgi:predicted transcriptional regulator